MSRKILIIDDDSSTLESIGSYLQEVGFEIEMATNGIDGLEIIKSNKPDLVITDVKMPRLGGVELNYILKGIKFNNPVIFISAYEEDKVNNTSEYFAFLHKPLDIFELTSQINRALTN